MELFYGDTAHLLCPLWNRRSPLPPGLLGSKGLEETVGKLQLAIQLADTGDTLQSEWLLRIKERIAALDVLKQIELMKTPKSVKARRLPTRSQLTQYLKSLLLPKTHSLLWLRGLVTERGPI